MKPSLDAIVIGAVGIDTNVYLYGQDIDWSVEANFSINIDYIGQAGGYSARGLNRLGKKVGFIGYIGADFSGDFIRREFEKDGIVSLFFTEPKGTNRSINMMYLDGRRKNFYDAKGAMELHPPISECRDFLSTTKLAHFSIQNWCRELLPVARELGITISVDIQDIVNVEDDYRRDFIDYADILFFSAANFSDPTPLIRQFLEKKPQRIVVCGRGKEGCALGTKDGIEFFQPLSMEKPVVDTNGAGDSLAIGFISSYILDGYSLSDSVKRGQIAARYDCTIKASTDELITAQEMEALYRAMKGD